MHINGHENNDIFNKRRGKLRIYFGYAAGVGKTFAMLNDAQELVKTGVDLVVGYVEPHARPETMKLLNGLEKIPTKPILYKGVKLYEFDLDSALKRNPKLIIVDELAHTNAYACRHKKRYQDIEELLQAGIDVFTTVNVQHIESLNDIVESITNIHVLERIPDAVFDGADEIELVDIEPQDLLDRLNKGKIYREKQARQAVLNFFTTDKLIALREIALRRTADQVKRIAESNIVNPKNNYGKEHILVCISPSQGNEKVIRTAARMAEALKGKLTAVFVETPEYEESSIKEQESLRKNLRLAEQLGAQISSVYGEDISQQLAEYANVSQATKIILGRSSKRKSWLKPKLVDKLSEQIDSTDIYIIPDTQPSKTKKHFKIKNEMSFSVSDSIRTVIILLFCTIIGIIFDYNHFSVVNIIIVYILGVQVNAVITKGRVYSIVSALLSVLIFNYFFTEPRYTLHAIDPGYPVTFVIMLAAAIITSTLTKRIKEQARQASQRAYRTEILLETSQKLQKASTESALLREIAIQINKLLEKPIIIYPVRVNKLDKPLIFNEDKRDNNESEWISKEERTVAEWVLKNQKRAGVTSNTFTNTKCLYLAVRGNGEVLAVIGIVMDKEAPMDNFEKSILIAVLAESALALEKEKFRVQEQIISLRMQQEQVRTNLLRAISHDLRTPLTSISGNAGVLKANSHILEEKQKQNLYNDIYDDSIWLINLVENLLSITRLDEGSSNINMQPDLIDEVISEALRHIDRKSIEYNISMEIQDEDLIVNIDSQLIMQVIINIVDNAIKYTPPGSKICIVAKQDMDSVCVEIKDNGEGIPDKEKDKIFDMFYTANNINADGRRGLGLGLYLCMSIIQAHQGEMYVKDNIPKGTIFGLVLPIEEVDLNE
ncbi:sensor histidine kinase KdpD [Listeria innocua]|uniref:sensor histidine kinase n=1 Tax=Listeria monocytogenes TaxID=1639 RepID=UPI001F107D7B|nr:sensor histidine kinase KdpD [Listeria monocytogenes]EKD7143311.1 sensor histidine kinase KdpD [Listeria innocua]EKD7152048.1 sensor histidine kinase KdpD [Listeria innocua]EKK7208449.1 sensor histidine kinase KdpD [Listeria innocua]MCH5033853.1 sensor histidine kinase KdpD [Listeria monocytogenes]HBN5051438.1 sensor histidine kinase KdpD [Listeria innocua]